MLNEMFVPRFWKNSRKNNRRVKAYTITREEVKQRRAKLVEESKKHEELKRKRAKEVELAHTIEVEQLKTELAEKVPNGACGVFQEHRSNARMHIDVFLRQDVRHGFPLIVFREAVADAFEKMPTPQLALARISF